MIHNDHVNLIQKAVQIQDGVWADFGSGWGAFTLALRDLGGKNLEIFSIDKNKYSLAEQKTYFKNRFPITNIQFLEQDFTEKMDLPPLDGILMANSLHYIEDQLSFLRQIKTYLKPSGKLVVVEYETDKINAWIPYPLSHDTFAKISKNAGFLKSSLLEIKELDGLNMYCAEVYVNGA